jgi:peptide/nickel transport system ATP-binding protein
MLTATELTAGYRKDVPVLKGLSLALEPGRTVGLLGPSGCGKSTLVRVLALLQAPWEGRVDIDGVPVTGYRYAAPASLRRTVGVVFQQPRLSVDPRFTLRRTVGADALAELVDLTPELLDRRPHEVSEGQLQRACLARALAVRPKYLLCDEMTAMLDGLHHGGAGRRGALAQRRARDRRARGEPRRGAARRMVRRSAALGRPGRRIPSGHHHQTRSAVNIRYRLGDDNGRPTSTHEMK